MSKGGGGGQSTTTEPWGAQKPFLKDLFARAGGLLEGQGPQLFQGQMTAGFNPVETEAQQSALGFARNFAPQMAQQTGGALEFLLGPALNPETNPALQGAIGAATRPITQQLTESTLPGIRGESMASGLYGSNRQGIAEGLASGRASDAVGDASARIASQGYLSGLDAMGRGLALAPQTQAMGGASAQALSSVGSQQRNYEQSLLNEAIQRYSYGQNLPYQQLAQYQNFIQGGFGGAVNQLPMDSSGNPLMAALGGGLQGFAMSGGNPYMAALGAAAGGLGSM